MSPLLVMSRISNIISICILLIIIYANATMQNLMLTIVNAVLVIVFVFVLYKPKFFYINIFQTIYFLIILAQAIIAKKQELHHLDEDSIKEVFMSFILLFSSDLKDFSILIETGKKILYEFRFFLLIIIGFVFSLISTSLIFVDKFTEDATPSSTPTKTVKPPQQQQKEKKD